MLFVRNADKPGFIGRLGSALGDAGVNIANFHLGRAEGDGSAVALIQLDGTCPPDMVKTLEALPDVLTVRQLKFD